MNILPNKSYTRQELIDIAGENYIMFLSASPLSVISSEPKLVIYTYNDFDENAKTVYRNLYNLIEQKNPNSNFLVFATGQRVAGTWRTRQEVDKVNLDNNTMLEYSPYEYYSTAKNLPTSTELAGVSSDTYVSLNPSNYTHRVIIPPNE